MKTAITILDSLDDTIIALKWFENYLRDGLGYTKDLNEVLRLIAWLEELKEYREKSDKYSRMIAALKSVEYFGSKQKYEEIYIEVCKYVERMATSLSLLKAANDAEKEYNGFVPQVTEKEMEWLKNNKELVTRMHIASLAHSLGVDTI